MSAARDLTASLLRRISPAMLQSLRMPRVGLDNNAARMEWVQNTLRALPAGLRLLDAGAGEQPYRSSCSHLQYIAQDFAQYDGKGDGTGMQRGKWDHARLDIISDVAAIPAPAASFDAILCTEVIEHVAEPIKVLHEFARLLRPAGFLILTAPFVSFTHFAPHHYHTGFSRYFYQHHLNSAGFDLVELSFNGNFFELLAQEVRRTPWAAGRYSNRKLTWLDSLIMRLFLRRLGRLNFADTGSSEFAALGIHVVARRRPVPAAA